MNSVKISNKKSSFIILSLFLIIIVSISVLFIVFQFKSNAANHSLDREHRLPLDKEDHLPSDKEDHLPSDKEDHLPSDKEDHLPSDKEDHLPSDKEDHLPSDKEDHLPSDKEDHLPSDKEDHLALDRELHCKCQNLPTTDFRIVNGTGLSSGLPWVGFLIRRSQKFDNMTGQYKTENEIVCTISIIGKKWAVTARHCPGTLRNKSITKENYKDYELYVGAGLDNSVSKILNSPNNLKKVFADYEINIETKGIEGFLNKSISEKVEILTNYSSEISKNDIRLLELEEPFEFGDETGVYPACLADFEKTDYDKNDRFLVAGYGRKEIIKNFWNSNSSLDPSSLDQSSLDPSSVDSSSVDPSSVDPSSVDPSSVDPSLRNLMITNFKLVNVTKEFIIAYNPSSSVCEGDSGGPLMFFIRNKLYVVGVMTEIDLSYDDLLKKDLCIPGTPVQSIPIYNHLDWIRNQTNNQTTKQLC